MYTTTGVIWEMRNGIIHITMPPTEGQSGDQHIDLFAKQGVRFDPPSAVQKLLRDNQPTKGVVKKIAIIPSKLLAINNQCQILGLLSEAEHRRYRELTPEDFCQIHRNITYVDLAIMGINFLNVFFPSLLTYGEEYTIKGRPQWLGYNNDSAIYAGNYGQGDNISDLDGAAFEYVP